MNMKRVIANSMQQALKQIREEFGPDAVILSSKKLERGIEVVCALNYNEEAEREQFDTDFRDTASAGEVARATVARQTAVEQEKAVIKRKLEATRQRLTQTQRWKDQPVQAGPDSYMQPGMAATSSATEPHNPVEYDVECDSFASPVENTGDTQKIMAEMRDEIMQMRALLRQQATTAASEQQAFASLLRSVTTDKLGVVNTTNGKPPVKLAHFAEELQRKFLSMGILPELCEQLLSDLEPTQETAALWQKVLEKLVCSLSIAEEELIDKTGCFVLVGSTGVGKTTTIAKLAARYVLKHGAGSIALVTTDRFRVAAAQQLQSFGRLLNVPLYVVDDHQSLDDVLDKLTDKRFILVDTAGLNPLDTNWEIQCQDLQVERHRLTNYLVLSAVTQLQVMKSSYHHYNRLNIDGCILTKLDEACSLGEVLSLAIINQLPVAYYTDGQQIPQDLHPARAHALVVSAASLAQQQHSETVHCDARTA